MLRSGTREERGQPKADKPPNDTNAHTLRRTGSTAGPVAAGLAEAQKGFRRVKGHRDLPELTAAIRRELSPTPTEEATAARAT